MTTADAWAALVGFVLPLLVAVINKETWKPWLKALVALGSSVVVGTITALLSGSFTGTTWVTATAVVFTASTASYKLWWRGSTITTWIERNVNVASGKSVAPDLGGTPGDSSGSAAQ